MIESAKKWIKIINEKEKPNLMVGLFHSGVDYTYGNQNIETFKRKRLKINCTTGPDLI